MQASCNFCKASGPKLDMITVANYFANNHGLRCVVFHLLTVCIATHEIKVLRPKINLELTW